MTDTLIDEAGLPNFDDLPAAAGFRLSLGEEEVDYDGEGEAELVARLWRRPCPSFFARGGGA